MLMDRAAPGSEEFFFKRETMRGAEGFFRVAQAHDGRWWLLDSEGKRFWFRGVNEVRGAAGSPHEPAARLRAWGFNAAGAGGDAALRDEGLPFVAEADFAGAGALIHAGGARLPDVFDPEWPRQAAEHAARVCPPLATARGLVGWLTDGAVAWAQPQTQENSPAVAARPSLLQICLSLEPNFAAYHAAWEFALALHGGRIEALARTWGVPVANKEVVRAMTRAEQGLATRGYLRDEARWSREFARRYCATTAAAIRAQDANHLVLGCRFTAPAGAALLAEAVFPAVDVPWLAAADVAAAAGGPVIAGEFSWVREDFFSAAGAGRARGLTTVERMLRRGRAALERLAAHPAAVGYAWSRWADGPAEQPPFARGLVHGNDAEAREHTELLAAVNARVHVLRGPHPI